MNVDPPSEPGKSSWPLITLAALSFIPVFGFFFAGAALTWALNSSRPRARLAGWMAVAGGVLNMVGMVFLALSGQHTPAAEQQARTVAERELGRIVIALETDHTTRRSYVASLKGLQLARFPKELLPINDVSGGFIIPPREYVYRVARDGKSYDLLGVGPDGKPDTDDDIRPVLSDSLREHSGFKPRSGV